MKDSEIKNPSPKLQKILEDRKPQSRLWGLSGPMKNVVNTEPAVNTKPKGIKNVSLGDTLIDNSIEEVTRLIKEHGIVRTPRTKAGKKLKKQERFLNILDSLYEKGVLGDVRASVEYLNRVAGMVSQTFDINQSKKKLIVMAPMTTDPEAKQLENDTESA